MTRTTLDTRHGLSALALTLLLAACGGGDADPTGDSPATDSASATETAQAASLATETTASTSQVVVAAGGAGQPVACPGGGSAQYTLTGGADDGVLAAGETYAIAFDACRGAAGLAALSGQATLAVTAWAPREIGLDLAYSGLAVALPARTVTLDGEVQLTSTEVYGSDGWPTTSTTTQWQANALTLQRQTAARLTTYTLDASLTHGTLRTAGAITGTTLAGTATLSAQWPNGQWAASLEANGGISFDEAGQPTGQWAVLLPARALDIRASTGSVVVAVDLGRDGSIDRTWQFSPTDWAAEAQ